MIKKTITGWAMLAAAFGIFIEIVIPIMNPSLKGEGTLGLIPLYFGFPVGALGLVILMWKDVGRFPAIMAVIGLSGILYFMGVYPEGVDGWLGGFFLAMSALYLPLPYRYAAVAWAGVGFLGALKYNPSILGFVDTFDLFGLATAISGIYMLWGVNSGKSEE